MIEHLFVFSDESLLDCRFLYENAFFHCLVNYRWWDLKFLKNVWCPDCLGGLKKKCCPFRSCEVWLNSPLLVWKWAAAPREKLCHRWGSRPLGRLVLCEAAPAWRNWADGERMRHSCMSSSPSLAEGDIWHHLARERDRELSASSCSHHRSRVQGCFWGGIVITQYVSPPMHTPYSNHSASSLPPMFPSFQH